MTLSGASASPPDLRSRSIVNVAQNERQFGLVGRIKGVSRRDFVRRLGAATAGLAILTNIKLQRAEAASCNVWPNQTIHCNLGNCHTCTETICLAPAHPKDKWPRYQNQTGYLQTCSCLWVACLGNHRCDGYKLWWMTWISNSSCCPCV